MRRFALLIFFAGVLFATETLHLRISSETVPTGGLAQIKLFVTAPQPIASGRIAFQRDPTVFGAVSDATVFSAMGDAYGNWFAYPGGALGTELGDLAAQFTSPSAGVGHSPDLPVLEITALVATGTHTVTLNLSDSFFKDPLGADYALDVQPGVRTVGKGTLSLSNVTPGGGAIPAGAVLSLQGTGFTPSTAVEIDGIGSAASEFVRPDLINVTLAAPTEMTGRRVQVRGGDEQVEYWTWLHYSPELFAGTPASECALKCGMIFPAQAAAAISWGGPLLIPRPNHAYGLALLNSNPVPVEVTVTQVGLVRRTATDSIPAWGSRNISISNPPSVAVETNPRLPIRILAYDYTPGGLSRTFQAYPVPRLANAAGGFIESVAPGEIISIYGVNLGVPSPAGLAFDSDGKVASTLEGTRVLANGVPAPLLYVSTSQINAVVPYEVAGEQSATIRVEYAGETSATWSVPVADTAPGIFQPVLNSDNSVNTASNRAARGSIIQIFATGEGVTSPPGVTGSITHGSGGMPKLHVTVTIGGLDAPVQSAGSVAEAVAGLFQVSVLVPQNLAPNQSVPIVLTVGSASSQSFSSIVVQ